MERDLEIPSRSLSLSPTLTRLPSYVTLAPENADTTIDADSNGNLEVSDTLGIGVRSDGRVDVNCHAPLGRRLSRLLDSEQPHLTPSTSPRSYSDRYAKPPPPKLNIVIQIAGSRGDVQPFVALGCALKRDHGHRVRIATHAAFEKFVRSTGLDFYPLGGDPTELMAYIVKNPGLIPSFASVKAGDIGRKRKMLAEMLHGCWKSCIEPDEQTKQPFVADAIIANPPSMGHVHCAQALSIPLHIMFTMPWSTTRAFSHPLANLNYSAQTMPAVANALSFGVVEFMMWQGVGDIVNRWRSQSLDLEPIPESDGPRLLERLAIPHTYCWSPALVPRPSDWPQHIDVCGFFFREPPSYEPPADLANFLDYGSTPIYIGFGSIVIDNPQSLTKMILEAIRITGVRALISRGWSNLGQDLESDDNIFFLGDCPHEWLFSRVKAVIHHGGAGTTACGLQNGAPTFIVPFFGDQPFWGNMVASAGAGPSPIPYHSLTTEGLASAIVQCLDPNTKSAAQTVAAKMKTESGVDTAVRSFHAHLPPDMDCQVLSDQPASWIYKKHRTKIRLSKKAAAILIQASIIKPDQLSPFRPKPFHIEPKRLDPITAILSASFQTAGLIGQAAIKMASDPYQAYKTSKSHQPATATTANRTQPPHDRSLALNPSAPPPHLAKTLLTTSAHSTTRLLLTPLKGLLLDIPLALTEGLRALPTLYNDTSFSSHEPITDWKSGAAVGAASFARGVRQGATDGFAAAFAGKKREGASGVAKGLGVGVVGFGAKTGAGVVGLVAYPCQGVWKSLYAATHRRRGDLVRGAKLEEGEWSLEGEGGCLQEVVQGFLQLRSGPED